MPKVREKLGAIAWGPGGASLGIASNQGGVAANYLTRAAAYRMMEDLIISILGRIPPATFIEMCTCPLSVACGCRKPFRCG
jgi:histidinol phosphatase-like enzyme